MEIDVSVIEPLVIASLKADLVTIETNNKMDIEDAELSLDEVKRCLESGNYDPQHVQNYLDRAEFFLTELHSRDKVREAIETILNYYGESV